MNRDCTFCAIVAGTGEASLVYEDDAVVGFLDTLPINSGHTLIIPRRHATFLAELDPADGARVFQAAQRLGAALRVSGLPCDGVNLLLNDGAEAGQRVFHTHMHVIPRTLNDNARFRRTEGPIPSREELDEVAAKIRAALNG
jgi:diadenosine tetraphosphate (Ap4A) HIT family hydrolase